MAYIILFNDLPSRFQLTYLANCGGSTCTGVDASSLQWVRVLVLYTLLTPSNALLDVI